MTKLDELGGLESIRSQILESHEFGHRTVSQSWFCNECNIEALIERVDELEEELASGGHKFQVVAAELDFCRAKLQRYRELAEICLEWMAMDGLEYPGEIEAKMDEMEAKARELLKED